MGRHLLLPEYLTKKFSNIYELCEKGSIVNTAIVMSVAERVVKNNNSVVLKLNGCHICFLRHSQTVSSDFMTASTTVSVTSTVTSSTVSATTGVISVSSSISDGSSIVPSLTQASSTSVIVVCEPSLIVSQTITPTPIPGN